MTVLLASVLSVIATAHVSDSDKAVPSSVLKMYRVGQIK